MTKTACIVGAAGQDGKLLEQFLRTRDYRLVCLEKNAVRAEGFAWSKPVDITRVDEVFDVVKELRPDEVYHLAAIHHSSQESAEENLACFRNSYEVNFFSLLNFLEAIRLHSKQTRLFYAASSHVFGEPALEVQNEATPFSPQSVYAMTKADGILACGRYRRNYGVFAAAGILYNHESRYRAENFLTKKVIQAVVEIMRGGQNKVVVGDLNAEVDWGYAPDYVEAMHAILEQDQADDFVVATGIKHTVRELVETAIREAGLDWAQCVIENPQVMKRPPRCRIGDASKLARLTGWKPKTDFFEMIRLLLREELARTRQA